MLFAAAVCRPLYVHVRLQRDSSATYGKDFIFHKSDANVQLVLTSATLSPRERELKRFTWGRDAMQDRKNREGTLSSVCHPFVWRERYCGDKSRSLSPGAALELHIMPGSILYLIKVLFRGMQTRPGTPPSLDCTN